MLIKMAFRMKKTTVTTHPRESPSTQTDVVTASEMTMEMESTMLKTNVKDMMIVSM